MLRLLALAASRGRVLLIAGLVAGVALPGLAATLRPWLPEMIAVLLFLAALRIGPSGIAASLGHAKSTLAVALVYQLALPLAVAVFLTITGLTATPAGFALLLFAAGSSIAGSPNLAILTGGEPAPALRLLIVGTALLPLTVIPVFAVAGAGALAGGVGAASLRLAAMIAAAASFALLVHRPLMRGAAAVQAVDGLSAIMMAVLVVGLMTAVSPALRDQPLAFLAWLAYASALNLGAQFTAAWALRRSPLRSDAIPHSISAGNRNIALFLVALPEETMAPILIFIGCYQIPMYLTPLIMSRVYRRLLS